MISLTELDILKYWLLIIYVSFLFVLSIFFILRYREYKQKEVLYMGMSFLFPVIMYTIYIISFFNILLYGRPIDPVFYIISTSLYIFFILFWMQVISNFIPEIYKKRITIITLIYIIPLGIIYYIIYLIFGIDGLIVKIERGLWVESTAYALFFIISALLYFFLTALIFITVALRSRNQDVRLKGKFLLIGLVCLVLGSVFEAIIILPGYWFFLTRIFQIIGGLFFYFGFTLPNWIKKRFLNEEI